MGVSSSGAAAAAAPPRTLEDVVALVMCQDPVANAKAAVTARIEGHGGRVVARLGKDVSHIVWERTRSRRPSDKAADEAQLMELFHRLEKLEYPPVVVSPLWVEESIKSGRRLVERKYLVKKPTESLLGRTPGSGGAAAKKRKRPAAAVLPKPAEAYELDDGAFSSTQQINGNAPAPAREGRGAAKQPRKGGAAGAGGKKQQQQQGGRAAGGRCGRGGGLPAVVEDEEEEEEGQQQRQEPGRIGTETQAVANILTIDLPDDEPGRTPGPGGDADGEEDELDTPLAMRFAKSSAERAAGWASGGSGKGSEERQRGGAGGAAGAGGGRSRLALASGPRQEAAEDGMEAQVGGGDEVEVMEIDDEGAASPGDQQAQQQQPQQQQQEAGKAGAAAKGVAERFSVRQLVQHPERPVVVHKGTPLAGSLPSAGGDRPSDPIPVPVVERVTSPWALAEQLPTQSQSQPSQPAPASGRPSIGQALPKAGGRRSLLGVSMRRPSPAGGPAARGTPGSAARGAAAEGGDGAGAASEPKPAPWSTVRPWDGWAAARQEQGQQEEQEEAAAAAAGDGGAAGNDENQAGPPQQQQQQDEQPSGSGAAGARGRKSRHGAGASAAAAAAAEASAEAAKAVTSAAAAEEAAGGAGPTHGCIALTSVDGSITELARSASRRLRGLRLCPEGKEEGQVTHLVLGGERRTIKLMLAVANGAWLLSPQWVTASLEAGRWLPESQFPAKVRFEGAAERARRLLESPDSAPLLAEHTVYVHLPEKARKLMGPNAAALKRVAAALGAKAGPPRSCSLCVVVGGGARPPNIPAEAACVQEEWLLLAAERFELPPMEDFEVA